MHLTLVFIGGATPEFIAVLHERVTALAPTLQSFAYELCGPQLFPDARRPRVLALVPRDEAGFGAWQAPLATACAELGCKPENRRYRPHLSLARLKQAPACELAAVPPLQGSARAIVLFESAGGHYQPLFSVPCAGTGHAE
jgi:2'-5' RNA ligase